MNLCQALLSSSPPNNTNQSTFIAAAAFVVVLVRFLLYRIRSSRCSSDRFSANDVSFNNQISSATEILYSISYYLVPLYTFHQSWFQDRTMQSIPNVRPCSYFFIILSSLGLATLFASLSSLSVSEQLSYLIHVQFQHAPFHTWE